MVDKRFRVGVVVPTYRSSAIVGSAIASISSQTYIDWTAVVVDDGSPDAASVEAVLRGVDRVHYLPMPHRGAAAARNSGIAFLDVDLIAFLDADDEWLPDYLERQLACLEAHPDWSAVYSDAYLVPVLASLDDERNHEDQENTKTQRLGGLRAFGSSWSRQVDSRLVRDDKVLPRLYSAESPSDGPVTFESLVSGTCNAITSGTIVRRQALMDVGGFDESLERAHDFDLWVRLVRRGHVVGYNLVPLVRYRVSTSGLSGDSLSLFERDCTILRHVSGYPDLNDAERRAVGAALAAAESRLELAVGKKALAASDYEAGRRAFASAWRHRPTIKTAAVCTLAHLAPRVLRFLAARRIRTR